MSADKEEHTYNEDTTQEEPDWRQYARREDYHKNRVHLDKTDYLALFLAAVQTIFLPLIVIALALVASSLILTFLLS